ncbi:hypothetical protein M3J09_006040 [Ascochyta lentis]
MWMNLWNRQSGGSDHSPQEEEMTSEQASKERQSISEPVPEKPGTCHFLRLPTELRLQIYAYTDLANQTIEVLNLPIQPTEQGPQCHRTYSTDPSEHHLLYRLERGSDVPYARKQKRCFSIHGLFSLTSVCSQTRSETNLSVYELNAFAFSSENYNYGTAIRAFTLSLSKRQLSVVRCVYWPLLQARIFQQNLHGVRIEGCEWACVEEFRALTGLERVVLRYKATDVEKRLHEYSEDEAVELEGLLAERRGGDYVVQRVFRRTLAVRGMEKVVGSDAVDVVCRKTWRAAF